MRLEPEQLGKLRENILAKEHAEVFMTLMNDVTVIAGMSETRFGWEKVGCAHCRTPLFQYFGVFSVGVAETNPIAISVTNDVLNSFINAAICHILENPACLVKTREQIMRNRGKEGNNG